MFHSSVSFQIDPTQPGMPNAQPPSSKSGEAPSSNNPSQQHDPSQLISLFHQNQTMHPPFNPMAAMMMQNPFMNANANAAAAIPSYPPPPMFQNPQSNGIIPSEVATAHGIINKINKKVKRKKKGKPKRPLSAYNLFFRDERTRILNTIPEKEKEGEEEESKEEEEAKAEQEDEPKQDEEEAKQEDEPKEEEKKKAGTKKKKTTPHGKIGFESLAKLIGKRWQELDPAEVDKYKKLAEVDSRRYRADMEVWLKKENEKSRDGADDEGEEHEAKKLKTGDWFIIWLIL